MFVLCLRFHWYPTCSSRQNHPISKWLTILIILLSTEYLLLLGKQMKSLLLLNTSIHLTIGGQIRKEHRKENPHRETNLNMKSKRIVRGMDNTKKEIMMDRMNKLWTKVKREEIRREKKKLVNLELRRKIPKMTWRNKEEKKEKRKSYLDWVFIQREHESTKRIVSKDNWSKQRNKIGKCMKGPLKMYNQSKRKNLWKT